MDSNHDIVPTLRMFDGLMVGLAADEIEALRKQVESLKAQLAVEGMKRGFRRLDLEQTFREVGKKTIYVAIEVPADWEQRLDMQPIIESQIAADKWAWHWPANVKSPPNRGVNRLLDRMS